MTIRSGFYTRLLSFIGRNELKSHLIQDVDVTERSVSLFHLGYTRLNLARSFELKLEFNSFVLPYKMLKSE